jgi:hypothetical protein
LLRVVLNNFLGRYMVIVLGFYCGSNTGSSNLITMSLLT